MSKKNLKTVAYFMNARIIFEFPVRVLYLIAKSVLFTWILSSCRRHKEKKEETAEPEADPERDQRTVFAYQVNPRKLTRFLFIHSHKSISYSF